MTTTTIAQQVRREHQLNAADRFDAMYGLAMLCEKKATSKRMAGPDFKVFTFSDGSEISIYWS